MACGREASLGASFPPAPPGAGHPAQHQAPGLGGGRRSSLEAARRIPLYGAQYIALAAWMKVKAATMAVG